MDHEQFEKVFEDQVNRCRNTLVAKASEYATDDRLHNFKVAAELQGFTARDALGGMMAKHTVSVYDLITDEDCAPLEMWNEKIGDHLNYLFLLKAIVEEELSESEYGPGPEADVDDVEFEMVTKCFAELMEASNGTEIGPNGVKEGVKG